MDHEIGFRLRLVRLRHQLSQRELAKRVGVAHATISLIESGRCVYSYLGGSYIQLPPKQGD